MGRWDADFIVVGSGLAGVSFALKAAEKGSVLLLSKAQLEDTNSSMAQGGIASVSSSEDSFAQHIEDTMTAGAGLCHRDVVEQIVTQAPDRISDLQEWGVQFDRDQRNPKHPLDLTREGGHSARRILHVADRTGDAIQSQLLRLARNHPRIQILENHLSVDLITNRHLWPARPHTNRCFGVYAMNRNTSEVSSYLSPVTVLATGGAGKVYLYTSNWSGATGDGIAMAYRAGARVANLEFMQFHPTCLYHPEARNFLISEALRGEGGQLIDHHGHAFMAKYHPLSNLAPRDIVARAIDSEIKKSGHPCVYLDMTHLESHFLIERFPLIYEKCLSYGINLTEQPIPVVPAAHYLCGGVLTDVHGRTDIDGLLAIGETGANGLHGANRLASNSLLECLATAHNAWLYSHQLSQPECPEKPPIWPKQNLPSADELVVISHLWDEVRRLMWNYVGIVRSHRRLARAESRLRMILDEVKAEDNAFRSHADLIELRNLALVAYLTVRSAQSRKESRGIHFNLDEPQTLAEAKDTILDD